MLLLLVSNSNPRPNSFKLHLCRERRKTHRIWNHAHAFTKSRERKQRQLWECGLLLCQRVESKPLYSFFYCCLLFLVSLILFSFPLFYFLSFTVFLSSICYISVLKGEIGTEKLHLYCFCWSGLTFSQNLR